MLYRLTNEATFLNREIWVFEYTIWERNAQMRSGSHSITGPKKSLENRLKIKLMASIRLDDHGLVCREVVPHERTAGCRHHRLLKRVLPVQPDIAASWIMRHDSAFCRSVLKITEVFWQKKVPALLPLPLFAVVYFLAFHKVKRLLKGHHCKTL